MGLNEDPQLRGLESIICEAFDLAPRSISSLEIRVKFGEPGRDTESIPSTIIIEEGQGGVHMGNMLLYAMAFEEAEHGSVSTSRP